MQTVQACVAAWIAKGEVVHNASSLIRADRSWDAGQQAAHMKRRPPPVLNMRHHREERRQPGIEPLDEMAEECIRALDQKTSLRLS